MSAKQDFIHTDAIDFVRKNLDWRYHIRLKSNTWLWRAPKPVMASHKQAQQRRLQIEFKVQTYVYRTD